MEEEVGTRLGEEASPRALRDEGSRHRHFPLGD